MAVVRTRSFDIRLLQAAIDMSQANPIDALKIYHYSREEVEQK
jgi:hypothetical protein